MKSTSAVYACKKAVSKPAQSAIHSEPLTTMKTDPTPSRSTRAHPKGKGVLRYGPNKTPYKTDLYMHIFGYLLVQEYDEEGSANGETKWWCLCTLCGSYKSILAASLIAGRTISCGCSRITHGLTRGTATAKDGKTPEYRAWVQAKGRCFNKTDHAYADYGGRGITMCAGWKHDFAMFFRDMGTRPPGTSLDRTNNNGHYSCGHCDECVSKGWPMNCKWESSKRQANNRRSSRVIEHDGKSGTVAWWAEQSGINYKTLWNLLFRVKMPIALALLKNSEKKLLTSPPHCSNPPVS